MNGRTILAMFAIVGSLVCGVELASQVAGRGVDYTVSAKGHSSSGHSSGHHK